MALMAMLWKLPSKCYNVKEMVVAPITKHPSQLLSFRLSSGVFFGGKENPRIEQGSLFIFIQLCRLFLMFSILPSLI